MSRNVLYASFSVIFLATTQLSATAQAQDASIEALGELGGGESYAHGISGDGSTVLVQTYTAAFDDATFRWTATGGVENIGTLGGSYTYSFSFFTPSISADGNVISGYSENALGNLEAFRWTAALGMQGLGTLGGVSSSAYAISADGSTVVGWSGNGVTSEAFRWTEADGMVGLGLLAVSSEATHVSADGAVIAGNSNNRTFHWTDTGGMVDIGDLGAGNTTVNALSADGSTIVGRSNNGVFFEAYRWTQADGIVGLGDLGGNQSIARAVSADGSIIAGRGHNGAFFEAFRWSQADGMQSLRQILLDDGVDLTGWDMEDYYGEHYVSDDGQVIVGTATYLGIPQAYIFMMGGLITPEEQARFLQPTAVPATQAQASMHNNMGQSLLVARNAMSAYFPKIRARIYGDTDRKNSFDALASLDPKVLQDIAPAAGGDDAPVRHGKRKALYAMGSLGAGQNNNFFSYNASGSTGILIEVSPYTAIGGGVIGSHNREETRLDGQSRSTAYGGSAMVAYEPPSALRIYAAFAAAALDVSIDRNYINGGGVDGSSGDTDGYGFGASVKTGYEFELYESAHVMPYVQIDAAYTSLDGYTEIGGGFPAVVGDQDQTFLASRIGVEISHDVTPALTMRGRTAWGHRYTKGGSVVASAAAITQAIPTDAGDRDWAEFGLGMNYNVTDKTTFTADLSGRAGKTSEPAVNVNAGFVWAWN